MSGEILSECQTGIERTPIKKGTIIGRRFENGGLVEDDSGSFICLYKVFIDKRIDDDLSFDALGYNGAVDRKIVGRVKSIVVKHHELTGVKYLGWVGLKQQTISHHKVFNTPDTEADNPNPNEYHCSLDRSEYTTRPAARSLAYELMVHANNDRLFVILENS